MSSIFARVDSPNTALLFLTNMLQLHFNRAASERFFRKTSLKVVSLRNLSHQPVYPCYVV